MLIYALGLIFQFHKGTIKTLRQTPSQESLLYFNSIKVRLKLDPAIGAAAITAFQFHKGTIKTKYPACQEQPRQISIP